MIASQTLEELAEELLESKWRRAAVGPRLSEAEEHALAALGPLYRHGLMHDLIDLVAQAHGRPVTDLVPMIRQRIADQSFIDETGDSVVQTDFDRQTDLQVQAIAKVLEQVRQTAMRRGEWSDAPMTPEMCG